MTITYQKGETVAAVATPPGEGGVAIIRVSGANALDVADRVFSGPVKSYQTHTVHYGYIKNEEGMRIDDVLIIPMLGMRSFTGEDTVEIHCHGGRLMTRRILDTVLQAGARQALPGEFSFKAFINGKIDLSQAEAIQELISAKNERAVDAAANQLQGKLSLKVKYLKEKLTEIAAILEAWVDFPEEGLEFASFDEVITILSDVKARMEHLLKTYHDGKIVHDGVAICLIGSPNVGKSSLMNALLDKERAIVSHIPGTTRDILEDTLMLGGMNIRLIDTAGIRVAKELIEQEGIKRAKSAIEKADLILLVLDATENKKAIDYELLEKIDKKKTVVIWNKIDLIEVALPMDIFPHVVKVSAKEKIGIDQLLVTIDRVIWDIGVQSKDEVLVTNVRHKEALEGARQALDSLINGLKDNISPEFLTLDIRSCLTELGKIIGSDVTEDILTAIFSQFCIGK